MPVSVEACEALIDKAEELVAKPLTRENVQHIIQNGLEIDTMIRELRRQKTPSKTLTALKRRIEAAAARIAEAPDANGKKPEKPIKIGKYVPPPDPR
jgi:hypothetical protein